MRLHTSTVIAGLDPAIHVDAGLARANGAMDPRVKPEGDSGRRELRPYWKYNALMTLCFLVLRNISYDLPR